MKKSVNSDEPKTPIGTAKKAVAAVSQAVDTNRPKSVTDYWRLDGQEQNQKMLFAN